MSKTRVCSLAAVLIVLFFGGADLVYAQHSDHSSTQGSHTAVSAEPAAIEFNAERAFQVSQQAIGTKLSNHLFIDSTGEAVRFNDLLGRPVVISMIYTSCHHICPTLTSHLANVADVGRDAFGDEAFSVLTVGFDAPVDTPQQMAMFAAQRGIQQPHWRFVSADDETIAALSNELGFLFEASPRGFDHITQTTVVDGGGTIRNQVYGVNFDAPLLIEPLKHILRGEVFKRDTVEGWWRDIKLLCTVYDPTTGRYHFDYSLIVLVIMGFTSLLVVAIFIVRTWRSSRRLGLTS
ncbi:MAG: SCO family protein [Arenicellales bacterium]|nr:SCO family protein [Arenicellales bacterium]